MEFIAKKFEELTPAEVYELLKARSIIFQLEQKIQYLDMDDVDYRSVHCFLWDNGHVTAYLRAYPVEENTVKVGRVLTLNHGNGTGRELMQRSIPAIIRMMHCKKICMDAQKYAVGFYEKFGFITVSDDFLEEGIVHAAMELSVE